MFRALIADDHPLFRTALKEVVGTLYAENEVFEASTLDDAMSIVEQDDEDSFELILLDLQMPGSSGFSGLIALRSAAPSVPIIIVSAWADRDVVNRAMTCGAAGFIPKALSKREIAEGIARVLSGAIYVPSDHEACESASEVGRSPVLGPRQGISALTQGELRVLDLLAEGKPNKIIAYELGIKESTVKAHITAILRKLRVHSRTQAVLAARQTNIPKP